MLKVDVADKFKSMCRALQLDANPYTYNWDSPITLPETNSLSPLKMDENGWLEDFLVSF